MLFQASILLSEEIGSLNLSSVKSDPRTSVRQLAVPLHDGIALATTLLRPPDAARGPALLLRTPYGRGQVEVDSLGLDLGDALARGYAVLVQDVRGRGESGGRFGFVAQEAADGGEVLSWIARQPWSDGRVATFGASYPGRAQLLLPRHHPALRAIAPAMAGLSSQETWWPDGALDIGVVASWVEELTLTAFADRAVPPWLAPLLAAPRRSAPRQRSTPATRSSRCCRRCSPTWRAASRPSPSPCRRSCRACT